MYTLGVIGRFYFIYILTNKSNKVLYTGITSNLKKRIWEHKSKQIKAGSRIKKIILVETNNPEYRDLYNEL